jgi:hypothetical protein
MLTFYLDNDHYVYLANMIFRSHYVKNYSNINFNRVVKNILELQVKDLAHH